jgi:hypothetical protein
MGTFARAGDAPKPDDVLGIGEGWSGGAALCCPFCGVCDRTLAFGDLTGDGVTPGARCHASYLPTSDAGEPGNGSRGSLGAALGPRRWRTRVCWAPASSLGRIVQQESAREKNCVATSAHPSASLRLRLRPCSGDGFIAPRPSKTQKRPLEPIPVFKQPTSTRGGPSHRSSAAGDAAASTRRCQVWRALRGCKRPRERTLQTTPGALDVALQWDILRTLARARGCIARVWAELLLDSRDPLLSIVPVRRVLQLVAGEELH